MKPQPESRGTILGYLAAFTLGIICMAVIVQVVRRESHVTGRADAPEPEAEVAETELQPPPLEPAPKPIREIKPVPVTRPAVFATPAPVRAYSFGDETRASTSPELSQTIMVNAPGTVQRPESAAPTVIVAAPGGKSGITGHAVLLDNPPAERGIPLDPQCAAFHGKMLTTRFFVVGKDRGLGDVVVVITEGLPNQQWPMPNQPLVLDAGGCFYTPYVAAAQLGQKLTLKNTGPGLCNAHYTGSKKEWNMALSPDHTATRPIEHLESFARIKCDVHPWQFAYVSVFDHPFFAVTDENGKFFLPPLPTGEYVIEARHRRAGTVKKTLSIKRPNELSRIDFNFVLGQEQPARD